MDASDSLYNTKRFVQTMLKMGKARHGANPDEVRERRSFVGCSVSRWVSILSITFLHAMAIGCKAISSKIMVLSSSCAFGNDVKNDTQRHDLCNTAACITIMYQGFHTMGFSPIEDCSQQAVEDLRACERE